MTTAPGVRSDHDADPAGEQGGIIAGWLVKLVVGMAILGLVLIEGAALITNVIGLDDAAGSAARAGHRTLESGGRAAAVEEAVDSALSGTGAVAEDVRVEGEVVHVRVTRTADLFVLDRIGPIARLAEASVDKTAPTGRGF